MKSYRCYFVSEINGIFDYRDIDCASDAEAGAKASALVAEASGASVELWDLDRLVAVFGPLEELMRDHVAADRRKAAGGA